MADQSMADFLRQLLEEARNKQDTSGDFSPHEDVMGSTGVAGGGGATAPIEHYSPPDMGTHPGYGPAVAYPDNSPLPPSPLFLPNQRDGMGAQLDYADTRPGGPTRYGSANGDTPFSMPDQPARQMRAIKDGKGQTYYYFEGHLQ